MNPKWLENLGGVGGWGLFQVLKWQRCANLLSLLVVYQSSRVERSMQRKILSLSFKVSFRVYWPLQETHTQLIAL